MLMWCRSSPDLASRRSVPLQVMVVPVRVNVNLKACTVEDLIGRRKAWPYNNPLLQPALTKLPI